MVAGAEGDGWAAADGVIGGAEVGLGVLGGGDRETGQWRSWFRGGFLAIDDVNEIAVEDREAPSVPPLPPVAERAFLEPTTDHSTPNQRL